MENIFTFNNKEYFHFKRVLMTPLFCWCFLTLASLGSEKQRQAERHFQKGTKRYEFAEKSNNEKGKKDLYKMAFCSYRKAAQSDHVYAQYYLGLMYYKGEGVIQSPQEAIPWFKKIADQKSFSSQSNKKTFKEAQYTLGIIYENIQGVEQSNKEAHKYFTLFSGGDAKTEYQLGMLYEAGKAVPQSYIKAMAWYTLSANHGYHLAQHCLGVMYHNGQGAQQSYPEALKWYKKAANSDNPYAQYNLAFMHDHAEGVEYSPEIALKYYKRAAKQGFAKAQCNLGVKYDYGQGVEQSDEEAFKWYVLCINQQPVLNERSLVGLQEQYDEKAFAQYNLGMMFFEGRVAAQSYEEAFKCFISAAEQNDAGAQYNLGMMCYNGQGVEKSYAEAIKWLILAAKQDHPWAQGNLGTIYDNGEGVEKSRSEALKWYKKAAKQNFPEAQYNLGRIYASDDFKEKSYKQSYAYFFRAYTNFQKSNLFPKCYNKTIKRLMLLSMVGRGTLKNLEKSIKLSRLLIKSNKYNHFINTLLDIEKDIKKTIYQHFSKSKDSSIFSSLNKIDNTGMYDKELFQECYKAALSLDLLAQDSLRIMFLIGIGCPQDYNLSCEWYQEIQQRGKKKIKEIEELDLYGGVEISHPSNYQHEEFLRVFTDR